MRTARAVSTAFSLLSCLLAPACAWAAKANPHEAPALAPSKPWWSILAAGVALAGICVAAFKSSKRTSGG